MLRRGFQRLSVEEPVGMSYYERNMSDKRKGRTFAEFAPRLAIRCLATLQREIAVEGGEDLLVEDEFESHAGYRKRILDSLERAMETI